MLIQQLLLLYPGITLSFISSALLGYVCLCTSLSLYCIPLQAACAQTTACALLCQLRAGLDSWLQLMEPMGGLCRAVLHCRTRQGPCAVHSSARLVERVWQA